MIRKSLTVALALLALLPLGGCQRSSDAAAPAARSEYRGDTTGRRAEPKNVPSYEDEVKKERSFIGRILDPGEAKAGYGWDGQNSLVNTTASVEAVAHRAQIALRGLNFVVNAKDSNISSTAARISAARQDGTTAVILAESKQGSSTQIKARVGSLGDRSGSERLLDEIQKAKPARSGQ